MRRPLLFLSILLASSITSYVVDATEKGSRIDCVALLLSLSPPGMIKSDVYQLLARKPDPHKISVTIEVMDRPPTYSLDSMYKLSVVLVASAGAFHSTPQQFNSLITKLERLFNKLKAYSGDMRTDYAYPLYVLVHFAGEVKRNADIQRAISENEWNPEAEKAIINMLNQYVLSEEQLNHQNMAVEATIYEMLSRFYQTQGIDFQ